MDLPVQVSLEAQKTVCPYLCNPYFFIFQSTGRWAYNTIELENAINKNFSLVIGRAAALSFVVETVVLALSLIWEVLSQAEFAINLEVITSLLIAISVVIMMACFYDSTREQLIILVFV